MNKKPEEMKNALHICVDELSCDVCPYYSEEVYMEKLFILALEDDKANLQAQNAELVRKIEQLQRERDAGGCM